MALHSEGSLQGDRGPGNHEHAGPFAQDRSSISYQHCIMPSGGADSLGLDTTAYATCGLSAQRC